MFVYLFLGKVWLAAVRKIFDNSEVTCSINSGVHVEEQRVVVSIRKRSMSILSTKLSFKEEFHDLIYVRVWLQF